MGEVNLDELIQQCITLITPQIKTQNLTIINNISDTGYIVFANYTRLKQVLINILSNAVKYNLEHGSITVDSDIIDKKYLRISITDTGNGLSKEEESRLFIPFERLNIIDNIEGTGIGLVITKHLVELMGGSIGVESTLGKGTTFWFKLELIQP